MVMSRLLGMAMLAIGEWDDARLHRASNVRIYEEVLEDLQADATEREVALLMKKMNIGVQEWYLDRQELSAPEHVDNRYPRLFDGLRIQHESFNDWFFKFDKGVWQDLGVASTFCMMTAHGTLNGAWARCIAPDEEQLPYGYACMQVYEQVKVTREGHPVTAKAERTAFAELSASMDELISEREAYVGNSAKLQRRLNRVKEAFVTEAFILIELHEEGDQLNGGSKWK
ncbi:uncharacterized protein HMPREF1541_07277 [Cyphellophora europaea CBS 101466]|uniref:Uncharacterized protein n=1 Tax=Cyphellophora europaea (strain CBS 101466) TaxID=1220924 RepID=W2RPJ4_CYPE1|nr:uncharacterized protein HMPREF1541_07277 [Cyphellophora europaea CBS 101466]ETN37654.1 hypothetical protein HMPREF1541_07277 [Cyphellophora europaea CBS 101466]